MITKLATAVGALIAVSVIVRPNSAGVMQAMGSGMSGLTRAAMGGSPSVPREPNADDFAQEAVIAIGEFWSGFGE